MGRKYDDVELYLRERAKEAQTGAPRYTEAQLREQATTKIYTNSHFNGSTRGYVGRLVGFYLISAGSLLLLYPLALRYLYGWVIANSTVSGRRTRLVIEKSDILAFWLPHWRLTLFTGSLYFVWAQNALYGYLVEHTIFDDDYQASANDTLGSKYRTITLSSGRKIVSGSAFEGDVVDFVMKSWGYRWLRFFTLGLVGAPLISKFYGWCLNNTTLGGCALAFTATDAEVRRLWRHIVLRTVVTFGLYAFVAPAKVHQFLIENTVIDQTPAS